MKPNEAYCVRCRRAVKPIKVRGERDRRGRPRIRGQCPRCGTAVYRYVPLNA